MKYSLFVILTLVWLVSCDSGQETPATDLRFNAKSLITLTGGSRWFEAADTGTYYDANVQFSLVNPSTSAKRIIYELKFGLEGDMNNDSLALRSRSGLVVESDTLTIDAKKTLNINDNYVVDICRVNGDWSKSYRYKLTIRDLDSDAEPLISEENVAGSTDLNFFFNDAATTEISPDPLGMLDSPDDSDYTATATDWMAFLPLYPNPSSNQTNL